MPHKHCIEVLLDLEDTGVKILDNPILKELGPQGIRKMIPAILSPAVDVCPRCGTVGGDIIKHGTKTSHIKVHKVTECDTYLLLKKQRYLCKDCSSTFTATTKLIERSCFIAKPVKTAILLKARNIMSEKDIAKEVGVSHDQGVKLPDSSPDPSCLLSRD